MILEERVPLVGTSTSDQQASKTVDEHHRVREEMENQRERQVKKPAFTVRHVVVLRTTACDIYTIQTEGRGLIGDSRPGAFGPRAL